MRVALVNVQLLDGNNLVPPLGALYVAQGCGLCDRAKAQLAKLRVEHELVDITGDPGLEALYREWLPVLEIDGERAFVYYLDEAALLRRLQPSG